MAKLYFKVGSDVDKVIQLRQEIAKLKQELMSMDVNKAPAAAKALQVQIGAATQEFNKLTTEAAKAGAVMENGFKTKIYQGSQAVNDLTQKITNQKVVIRDIESDIRKLSDAYRSVRNNPLQANNALGELNAAKKVLQEEKAALFGLQTEQSNTRLSVKRLRDEYALYKNDTEEVIDANGGMSVSFKNALASIGGIYAVKELLSEITSVTGMFQKYESVLTNALNGDSALAKQYMGDIATFAAETNFQLDELTDNFIKLVNRGVTPTIETFGKLGDFANVTAKPMAQLNEAILDINNPERWKEFGVQVSTEGKKVNLTFRGMKIEAERSVESVMNAIEQFASMDGVAGTTKSIAGTIEGQISNLEDTITTALNEIGQGNKGLISGSIEASTVVVQNYDKIGKAVLALVATYGAYRASLILTNTYGVYDVATKNLQFMATMKNVVATNALIIRQKILNSTMMKNPYVMAATLVIGAAAAMWALYDGTTEAEKAQKKFNEAKEEAIQREKAHKTHIDSLISTIQDETVAEMNRIGAMDQLKTAYPHIFAKYVDEKGHLTDIIALKKEISEFDARISVDIAKRQADRAKQELIKVNTEINYRQGNTTGLSKFFRDKTTSELSEMQSGLLKSYQLKQEEYDKLASLERKANNKPIDKTRNKEYWEDQKKAADKALDEISSKQKKLLDAGKFEGLDAKVVQNYKNQSKLLKEAQEELKVYDSSGKYEKEESTQANKLREQQDRLTLLLNKQALDQSRSEQDLQNQVAQSRIDAMKDGSTKTIEQMQLNHKKEMQQFEREKEDRLRKAIEDARAIFDVEEDAKKAKNPKYIKGVFEASGIKLPDADTKQYDTQKGFIGEKQKRETEEYYKFLRDSYQDYTDQRIAIEEKFNTDIATLQESRKKYEQEGNTEKVQQTDRAIAQATKDKGQGLMQLDYDKLKESPEYVRAFENLKQTSSETLNSLLSQFESAKNTAAKVLSPDQLREYTTTIQEIMNELDSRNPWQTLSDKKQELADAEQELAQAQIELENARQTAETVKGGGKVEYTTTEFNQKTGKIDSTKAYLTEAQALDNVKSKTDKYNKSKDNVAKSSAKVVKAEKDVTDQIDELSKAISDVGNSIGGPAGEIISLIGDIGNFTMMAISGVKAAADTSAQAISTVEKASVILMIISAAIQLATKVADMFAADYSDYNESKENYEKYVEVLDVVISKQKELIETLTGREAVKASEDALRLIEKQAQAARNLGKERLNAGASAGSHSIGVRIKDNMSSTGWDEARNSLGEGAYNQIRDGRMTGLFDLSVEQLKKLQMEAPEFWAKLDEDVSEYLDQIIACNKNAEEMKNVLNEALTGISFDSLSDSFLDALSDMDTSAADFANDFSNYMQKAILNTMMAKTYEKRLNDWYESFAKANGDDVGVDSEEYKKLQDDWDKIVSDALEERNAFKEQFGWTSGDSSSQDSSKGGFQAMSQDTGEELNGRFTALQIAGEEAKNQSILQTQSLSILTVTSGEILSVGKEIRDIADETRTILANSYLELVQISENTEESAKYLKEIKLDIAEVKKNTKAMAG